MKKIKKQYLLISGILVIVLSSIGCSKFLETDPISEIGVNAFYKTESDFNQAAISIYVGLADATIDGNSYYFLLTDLRSDNGTNQTLGGGAGGAKGELDQFEVVPSNEHVTATYQNSYVAIRRANDLLSQLSTTDAQMDQSTKDQFKGEALAARAYMYFNLVRFFGGVPLVTEPFKNLDETYAQGRSSVDDVYKQIIDDLKDAANLLPPTYPDGQSGRITSGAAKSMLGTVYLTLHNYSDAVTILGDVVNSGQYSLLPDYQDVFDGNNQGNSEAIWQILYQSGGQTPGSSLTKWFAPNDANILAFGQRSFGFCLPTHDLELDYEPDDIRKDITIAPGYYDNNGNFVAAPYVKYYAEATVDNNGFSDVDWNIVRFADVLLRYAEAVNEVNNGPNAQAYEAINKVRTRAGLPVLSGLDYDGFKEAVYHEERMESPFEGHRWFDLIRTGRAVEVMNSKVSAPGDIFTIGISRPIQESQLLYPMPLAVTSVSPNIK